MKKILGLDIGTTSIGWAIVEATDEKKENDVTGKQAETDINNDRIGIHKDAVGVRIISQDTERFNQGLTLNDSKGSTLTPTATRRKYRGVRRMNSRYKLRRDKLLFILDFIGLKPDGSFNLEIYGDNKRKWINTKKNGGFYTKEREYFINEEGQRQRKKRTEGDIGKQLYKLRNKALISPIDLTELGRIFLHLNQLRGYSSDRFLKEEKPKFDYYLTEVLDADFENKLTIAEDNNKEEVKYYKIAVRLRFDEPYNIGDNENKQFITEIEGFLFKKDINFKQGDFVTIKKPEFKQDKKGKKVLSEYYKITLTTPDPTDWNYKYQTLQKSLTEWCGAGGTVGSYFFHNFYEAQNISRIRNNVINRNWYEQEFDKIWETQFQYHKDFFYKLKIEDIVKHAFKDYQPILNEVLKKQGIKDQLSYLIKDKVIFYQRPWQQAKNKGQCLFERIKVKKEVKIKGQDKKEIIEEYIGRTVIPRSHPLFQEFKIWQQINNVRIFLNNADTRIDLFENQSMFKKYLDKEISEVKELLYDALQKNKTLSWRVFVKDTLGIKNVIDEFEENNNKIRKKKGLDIETGEVIDTYFSVNFRKRKKDGTYEDIKLKGNTTKNELQKILTDKEDAWFNEVYKTSTDKHYKINPKKENFNYQTCSYQVSNLQLLWEIIYDITITDKAKLSNTIKNKFSKNAFSTTQLTALTNIKFDDIGMASLSAKAIRQILPLMNNGINISEKVQNKISSLIELNSKERELKSEKLEGLKNFISDKKARIRLSEFNSKENFTYLNYWEAVAIVYGSHSTKNTITQPEINRVKSHSMNNPVVEKIVNETISIVNEIFKKYGFDEVRIELSRELKASMDERQQMWESMNNNAEKNEWAKQMLREAKQALFEDDRNVENLDTDPANKSNIEKMKIIEDVVRFNKSEEYKSKVKEYKLGEPTKAEVKKYLMWLDQNFRCPYTNQPIPLTDVFAKGKVVEIEHILPKERYYLNSYSNKVITWREVNQAKSEHGNRTAYEFIVSKRKQNTISVGGNDFPLVAPDYWEEHVKSMFPKGGKQTNLLRKEIPEDPINRTLKETQYITKKLKEKLAELVGEKKVWVTSGAVTDILRDRWHLNGIMKELMRNRFENFEIPTGKKSLKLKTIEEQEEMLFEIKKVLNSENAFEVFKIPIGKKNIEIKEKDELQNISLGLEAVIYENKNGLVKKIKTYDYSTSEDMFETKNLTHLTQQYNSKTERWEDVEVFEGYSKRLDHRHHALDAIIIACTKQNHIQYINTLNAINTADQEDEENKKSKYSFIKEDVCLANSSKKFKTPWFENKFMFVVKKILSEVIISHKNTRLLISPSKHRINKDISFNKLASIRGELHKETNYAKKNYFEGDKTDIVKLIPFLFRVKKDNQYQTMVHFKSFKEIIKDIVLKEKYQNILIELFDKYDTITLNDKLIKELSKEVLTKIEVDKLLYDLKTNHPLKWLSTYSEKDKSSRPLGLSMDLNKIKEVSSIVDPRIKRLAGYRLTYVNEQKSLIDELAKDTQEKNRLKRDIESLKLFSNAIYEVRIKKSDNMFEWLELKNFHPEYFDRICYSKHSMTKQIKEKLSSVNLNDLKQNYFTNPIFLSSTPIEVKKVRQIAFNNDLYEITKDRYVFSRDVFMTYVFVEKDEKKKDAKRSIEFLKLLDAARIVSLNKPDKIDYKTFKHKVDSKLIFTLAKNDLVYLPTRQLTHEQIEEIKWDEKQSISPYLYIVKDMNPSRNEVVFQQFYKANSIKISELDAKSLFNNPDLKEQIEEIKYGNVPMLQRCIKVFTNKLGNTIIPYWEFPNGCWDNNVAFSKGFI
jgi:CRISPR-associated endonuclease Csn1